MLITFVAHSIRVPSGGLMAVYEYANALTRRGHGVRVLHKWHPFANDRVGAVDDIAWFRFEPAVEHVFSESMDDIPPGDFVFWPPSTRYLQGRGTGPPEHAGLPLMFVQGDLTGTSKLATRMRAPFPKVCVARWLAAVGLRAGVPEVQLLYLPCGIRHDIFRLTEPIAPRPAQVSMLYSDHPKKGSRLGLEALAVARRRVPELRAVVFGTRPPETTTPDWVTVLVDPARDVLVNDVYNRSRVFLQPSLREGFGFTAVEAMAGGCALVTTSNGGSDDYAYPGETALVTDPGDVDAMADGVVRLLRDDEQRVRLAQNGNSFIAQFDWDTSAEKLERFLHAYAADPLRYRQMSPHQTELGRG
jgi:glycosyltransferase involved in cell wall biosynthesis